MGKILHKMFRRARTDFSGKLDLRGEGVGAKVSSHS
jgi:hypothetical protein